MPVCKQERQEPECQQQYPRWKERLINNNGKFHNKVNIVRFKILYIVKGTANILLYRFHNHYKYEFSNWISMYFTHEIQVTYRNKKNLHFRIQKYFS